MVLLQKMVKLVVTLSLRVHKPARRVLELHMGVLREGRPDRTLITLGDFKAVLESVSLKFSYVRPYKSTSISFAESMSDSVISATVLNRSIFLLGMIPRY